MTVASRFRTRARLLVLVPGLLWAPALVTSVRAEDKPAAQAAAADKLTETARYGVYFQRARIGSMISRTFDTRHQGKPAVRLESDTDLKLAALGSPVEQTLTFSQLVDAEGKPLTLRYITVSMGRTTTINAAFETTRVVCTIDTNGQPAEKIVPIPKGITLAGDPQGTGVEAEILKVGQKTTLHFFEPLTLTIQKSETTVVRSENRTVGGKSTPAFLLRNKSGIGSSESWVDAKGQLLEDNSPVGIRIVREDVPSDGPGADFAPPKDFAVATSVVTKVKLSNPRRVNSLRVRLSGIPEEKLLISDPRQRVSERKQQDDLWSGLFQVESRPLPTTTLPLAPATETGPGLGDAVYLGIANPEVLQRAREIAGKETDRGLVARRLRSWVRQHMLKQSNIGTPRGAVEIMRSRDGVCRDYATLFAALARAVGLPTRVCSGIVYHQGAFFYHAWVECRLTAADDGWFPFDPTLDDDFVDATHIKLAQGDPVEMYGAVAAIGRLQAEILEHREAPGR